jgi:hypothetical protein
MLLRKGVTKAEKRDVSRPSGGDHHLERVVEGFCDQFGIVRIGALSRERERVG